MLLSTLHNSINLLTIDRLFPLLLSSLPNQHFPTSSRNEDPSTRSTSRRNVSLTHQRRGPSNTTNHWPCPHLPHFSRLLSAAVPLSRKAMLICTLSRHSRSTIPCLFLPLFLPPRCPLALHSPLRKCPLVLLPKTLCLLDLPDPLTHLCPP